MMKLIAAIKRRSDLTHQEFRDYYEKNHVPLVLSQIGDVASAYTRNYVGTAIASMEQGAEQPRDDWSSRYDCIMEITLRDRETLDRMFARIGAPEIEAMFVEDEKKFVDREFSRIFICETVTNELERNA